jgi:hypothetical protein
MSKTRHLADFLRANNAETLLGARLPTANGPPGDG